MVATSKSKRSGYAYVFKNFFGKVSPYTFALKDLWNSEELTWNSEDLTVLDGHCTVELDELELDELELDDDELDDDELELETSSGPSS